MSDFFDRKIDEYDTVHGRMMANKEPIADMIPKGAKRVLDLGVGTGLELCAVAEKHKNVYIKGIDISEQMLKRLEDKKLSIKLSLVHGDFFETDFGEDYYAVISSAALHHFAPEDKTFLYKKIFASLKDGGLFINSDRIAKNKDEELILLKEYEENPNTYPHMDTPLTGETDTVLLKAVGFSEVEITDLANKRYKIVCARK